MVMSPEERRRRMHKALGHDTSGIASEKTENSARAEKTVRAERTARPERTVRQRSVEKSEQPEELEFTEKSREERAARRERTRSASASGGAGRNSGKRASGKRTANKRAASSEGGSVMDKLNELTGGRGLLMIGGILLALILIFALIFGVKAMTGKGSKSENSGKKETTVEAVAESAEDETEAEPEEPARDYLGEAKLMYAQYDYDNAIELLKSMPEYDTNEEAKSLVAQCEETKGTLVEYNLQEITHIFFHILTVDAENSFDSAKWGNQAGGYNSLMTTISEFNKMMEEMYAKGYVLVSMHDMAKFTTNADGTVTMEKGKIMLPPGKKAFVMSEDDVCYYEYMTGAGYADKMIIGDDGRPTLHYTDKDGNEFVGDYDLVGCLDTFIDKHPDFSYKGHKACLVFTGYNGILGYRTDESYRPDSEYYDPKLEQGHDVDAERAEAVEVLKALVADGYDVGSHSWGHRDLGQIEFARFQKDCDRWERNVASLIREATGEQPDIIIYPKGADVADWHGYDHSNARFDYMWKLGFRIFCNVDSSQYWVQFGSDHMRQGRRALDGYNMWNDIANGYNRLGDLFDNVSDIFDPLRPTPVPAY